MPLRFYGGETDAAPLEWGWVEQQLAEAGTYWVSTPSRGHPHPRPVWGVWVDRRLLLSLGTPALRRAIAGDPRVTVHLDSGTDVVIVEGRGSSADDPAVVAQFLAAYDDKYDWTYDVDQYPPPTLVEPDEVLAWRSGGWAGRDGFQQAGKWTLR
jgi:Pyridoxamine 5'-phosphate oxidase